MSETPGGTDRDVAVLLVNLGTPDAPTPSALRRYLREFLSDPRVIEVPRPVWWFVLRAFVLPFRPRKSAAAYAAIWDRDSDESPLRGGTRRLCEAVASRFENVRVDWAMRYGSPSIEEQLGALLKDGSRRVLVWPLYPQYSASTTASVVDELARCLARLRVQPSLRVVPPYFCEPSYIEALAATTRRSLDALSWEPELLLISFHGLPEKYVERGDPYPEQCQLTARALREALGVPAERFAVAFQSRFGPARWIGPQTDRRLAALPKEGIRKLAVLSPGFAADCVETLEELGIRGRATFLGAGGSHFALLPCLNDAPEAVALAESVLGRELSGWL